MLRRRVYLGFYPSLGLIHLIVCSWKAPLFTLDLQPLVRGSLWTGSQKLFSWSVHLSESELGLCVHWGAWKRESESRAFHGNSLLTSPSHHSSDLRCGLLHRKAFFLRKGLPSASLILWLVQGPILSWYKAGSLHWNQWSCTDLHQMRM